MEIDSGTSYYFFLGLLSWASLGIGAISKKSGLLDSLLRNNTPTFGSLQGGHASLIR